MVRLVGVDLPRNKRISYALTYIHGIGITSAKKIVETANISPKTRTNNLTTEETIALREVLENIDLKYCEENNIEVFRSPEGNRDALAEHTLGMLLSLINNLNIANSEVRNNIWEREKNRGTELKGKVSV